MSADYNKMPKNQMRQKDTKLEVEPVTSQMPDFIIDARALMQAKHDPSSVFLNRMYSAWEFRIFYFCSEILSLAGIINLFVNNDGILIIKEKN